MSRHPLRWGNALTAVLLALVLLGWAVWDREVLDVDDAGIALAGTLIVAGLVGVVATLRPARDRQHDTPTDPTEGQDDGQEAHSQH